MTDKKNTNDAPATGEPTPAERVTVTLKKPHSHGGQDGQPGDKIEVTPRQKAWLSEIGVI